MFCSSVDVFVFPSLFMLGPSLVDEVIDAVMGQDVRLTPYLRGRGSRFDPYRCWNGLASYTGQ